MSTAVTTPYVPLEDFLEMAPEPGMRFEWCAGIVFPMSGGAPKHANLGARVIAALSALAGNDCTVYDSNADIWVDAAQFYGQADASLVCGALRTYSVSKRNNKLGEAITNPVVIAEVLSPSTEARDRGEKFSHYKLLPSLHECVLIAQAERHVEVRRRENGGWSTEIVTGKGSVMLHGTAVTLDDLYGKG